MANDETYLLVSERSADFCASLEKELAGKGWAFQTITPRELSSADIVVDNGEVQIARSRLRALWFDSLPRCRTPVGVVEDDADFCGQELAAIWIALHECSSVVTLNRLDAELWYCRSEWPIWHRRLRDAGLPTADVSVGIYQQKASWLPWGGGIARLPGPRAASTLLAAQIDSEQIVRIIACCGEAIPERSTLAKRVTRQLAQWSINLAEVLIGDDEVIVSCSAFPEIEAELIPILAPRIAESINADLRAG